MPHSGSSMAHWARGPSEACVDGLRDAWSGPRPHGVRGGRLGTGRRAQQLGASWLGRGSRLAWVKAHPALSPRTSSPTALRHLAPGWRAASSYSAEPLSSSALSGGDHECPVVGCVVGVRTPNAASVHHDLVAPRGVGCPRPCLRRLVSLDRYPPTGIVPEPKTVLVVA